MATKKNQHVVPTKSGWGIKREGNLRNTKLTETKEEAMKLARKIAKKEKSELVIHGKDGKINDKDSFGNDPFPARDKVH